MGPEKLDVRIIKSTEKAFYVVDPVGMKAWCPRTWTESPGALDGTTVTIKDWVIQNHKLTWFGDSSVPPAGAFHVTPADRPESFEKNFDAGHPGFVKVKYTGTGFVAVEDNALAKNIRAKVQQLTDDIAALRRLLNLE